MIFITNENDINNKSNILCLYFYASWMPYHKKMLIMIDKMEQKYKNINFVAIDTDYFDGLCKRFNIDAIPTTIILNNMKEIKRIKGLVMTSAFKSVFVDISKLGESL